MRNRTLKTLLSFVFVVTVLLIFASCDNGGETSAPGTLDTSFGIDGVVLINRYDIDFAYDITTDSTGRILAAGYIENSGAKEMAIWCLDDDGDLDLSFVTNGIAKGEGNAGYGIAVDSTDRVVVVGRAVAQEMAAWRYQSDGTPDLTFGSNGVLTHGGAAWVGGPGYYDRALKVAIDSSDRILAAGESVNEDGNDDMVVWCITDSGNLDTTFGGDFNPSDGMPDGFAVHNGAASTGTPSNDYGYDLVVDSKGRIIIDGQSRDQANDYHATIWRYNSDGTLDTIFGGDFNPSDGTPDGFVVYPDPSSSEAVAVDSGDRIIIAGVNYSASAAVGGMTIWRYNTDGVLDTTFGGDVAPADGTPDGFTVFNAFEVMPTSVAVDQSGRILVVGMEVQGTDIDMVLFRFNSNGLLDTSFGPDVSPSDGIPDGFVIYDNDPFVEELDVPRSVHIDSYGRILVTGGSIISSSGDMIVLRFNP